MNPTNIENEPARYVAGLMFNTTLTAVALIRKVKPTWQAGKLNGIGGKIENGEEPITAMVREFTEETGMTTLPMYWSHFLTLEDVNLFAVHFFATTGELYDLKSPEEEQVEIVYLTNIDPLRGDCIENIPWIISLALDHLQDGRPSFTKVTYPPFEPAAKGAA